MNTENMNSLSALDHRKMEKFLSLVRPPMRVHQLISRSDIGHKKYNLNLSPASSGFSSFTADPSPDATSEPFSLCFDRLLRETL